MLSYIPGECSNSLNMQIYGKYGNVESCFIQRWKCRSSWFDSNESVLMFLESESLVWCGNGWNSWQPVIRHNWISWEKALGPFNQLKLTLNTLRPRQNGRHFSDDIFKWIFLNENVWISITISLTRRQAIIWTNDGLITDAYMHHSLRLSGAYMH